LEKKKNKFSFDIEINNGSENCTDNNYKSLNFKYFEKYNSPSLKKFKNIIFLYTVYLIILNINTISCDSFIIVKINKTGNLNILHHQGIIDNNNLCSGISTHNPNSMTINGQEIAPPFYQYNFTSQTNTIRLYYNELKSSYECLFFGCSDIDEIDASNLNTSNVNYMRYMFGYCSSLTSINLLHIDTSYVRYMNNLLEGCTSLNSLDLSSFDTSSVQYFNNMFNHVDL